MYAGCICLCLMLEFSEVTNDPLLTLNILSGKHTRSNHSVVLLRVLRSLEELGSLSVPDL